MATLKISDLSVGDWVGVRCGTTINAFKVEEIRFNHIIHKYVALLNNRSYGLPTTELHPIPITAEILEKNGFEKISKTQPWFRYKTDITVGRYADVLWGFGIGVACNELWGLAGVHDLQHALRLAGVDEEINL